MKKNRKSERSKAIIKDNVGQPLIFFIIPFSYNHAKCKNNLKIDCIKKELEFITDIYYCGNEPSNEILKQIYNTDADVYSNTYIKDHPFQRAIITNCTIFLSKFELILDIILTFHNDGYGTLLMINRIQNNCTIDDMLVIINYLHKYNQLKVILNSHKCEFTIDMFLSKCLNSRNKKSKIYNRPSIGSGYPLIVLYSNELDIIDVNRFAEKNLRTLYGLAFQDFYGWKRVRENVAKNLLDINLSRRDEYNFYVTPIASIEIDSKERIRLIREWAINNGISEELQHFRVLMERALILETLILQKHIMISINSMINKELSSNFTNYTSIVRVRREVARGLCDYFNIHSQNEKNQGAEWILYGQHRLKLDRHYFNIKERIDALETSHNLLVRNVEYKQTAIVALIMLLFGSTAAQQLVDLFLSIPSISYLNIDGYRWLLKLVLSSVFVIVSIIIIIKSIIMSKKSSNKKANFGEEE